MSLILNKSKKLHWSDTLHLWISYQKFIVAAFDSKHRIFYEVFVAII